MTRVVRVFVGASGGGVTGQAVPSDPTVQCKRSATRSISSLMDTLCPPVPPTALR